jgi:ankyrin repeat protein
MLLDPKYDTDLEPQTYFLKLRPLHCAISARNRQCVLQLLQVTSILFRQYIIRHKRCCEQAGADFEAVTGVGERPLTLAIRRDDPDIFEDLLAYGANPAVAAPSIWDGVEAASPQEMVHDRAMVPDPAQAARFQAALEKHAAPTI